MIIAIVAALLVLAFLSYRFFHSWLFPPALYSLYWAAVIAVAYIFGYGQYRLTVEPVSVFVIGALCFAAGGMLALQVFGHHSFSTSISSEVSTQNTHANFLDRPGGSVQNQPRHQINKVTRPERKALIQTLIVIYSIGLMLLVPLFVQSIERAGAILNVSDFAVAARLGLGQLDRAGIPRYFLSLSSIGGILAYYAAWLYVGTRRDKVTLALATLAPLLMYILTFARSPVYALVVGVLAILTFRKTIKLRTAMLGLVSVLIIALAMGSMLGKGPDFRLNQSPIGAVFEKLTVYYIGGPIGFGQVMDNPQSVGEHGLSLRFFTQAAQSLGLDIYIPSNITDYVSGDLGNVYTFYFAYWLDWGWWGIIIVSALAGFVSTAVYVLARRGNAICGVALAMVIAAILNSTVVDGFFGSAIPWLLTIATGWLLWHIPLRVHKAGVSRKRTKTQWPSAGISRD